MKTLSVLYQVQILMYSLMMLIVLVEVNAALADRFHLQFLVKLAKIEEVAFDNLQSSQLMQLEQLMATC